MRSVILSFFLALFSNQVKADGSAHEYTFNSIDGEPMPFSSYKGKALLVVNTASKCGFTGQYNGLQSLWENYKDKGLVVVGVPSNDFAGQEPGSKEQIKEFCSVNFNVNFPMTSKVVVKGVDGNLLSVIETFEKANVATLYKKKEMPATRPITDQFRFYRRATNITHHRYNTD